MPVSKEYRVVTLGSRKVLFDPQLMIQPGEDYFSCKVMRDKGLVTGSADGRGETCFYHANEAKWALRHYLRGGLIARFLNDNYFGLRLENTRAWREWHLLNKMRALNLPVPVPVAASVIKAGFFYQADLITEYLDDTNTLSDVLSSQIISKEQWFGLGQVIRQFHNEYVFHSDLNARNILIDKNDKIYLIDFDQCGIKKGEGWKAKNLERLKRSLIKFQSKQEVFYFDDSNWQSLLEGYEGKE